MFLYRLFFGLLVACLCPGVPCVAQEPERQDITQNQGDMFMVTDSLSAVYAGWEREQPVPLPGSERSGNLIYERTLLPLAHVGANVFQPLLDNTSLLSTIRSLKDNTSWDPFNPMLNGSVPYTYNYDRNGATRNTQAIRASLEQSLGAQRGFGYRIDGRYSEAWGPFPNHRTTQFQSLFRLSFRKSPTSIITIRLLGLDNGWHLRRGNRVYADRARFILEDLNQWRARTGGLELDISGQASPSVSYRGFSRVVTSQWVSEPIDPDRLNGQVILSQPVFLDGILPVTMTPVFMARKSFRSITAGGEVSWQANRTHRVLFGVQGRLHTLSNDQLWQTPDRTDQFDLRIAPREFAFYIQDRLRFGTVVMGLGLRYDIFDAGDALNQDYLRTLGDTRAVNQTVRNLLVSAGGQAKGIQLLSPQISVSYPSGRLKPHMTFSVSSQLPSFEDLYNTGIQSASPYTDRSVTSLQPQRRTMLETGVGMDRGPYTFDITAFFRDAERYTPVFGPDVLPQALSNYTGYWGRTNVGFREQGGIETVFTRRLTPVGGSKLKLSFRASYLYLKDLGAVRESTGVILPESPLRPGDFTTFDTVINNFWNRRHWLSLGGSLRFSSGLILSAIGHLQSGIPYRLLTSREAGEIVSPDERPAIRFGPWYRRLDTRIDVPLPLRQTWPTTSVFFEVRNVTNASNIETIPDPAAFEESGRPDSPLLDQRQWVYGLARAVWFGVGIRW